MGHRRDRIGHLAPALPQVGPGVAAGDPVHQHPRQHPGGVLAADGPVADQRVGLVDCVLEVHRSECLQVFELLLRVVGLLVAFEEALVGLAVAFGRHGEHRRLTHFGIDGAAVGQQLLVDLSGALDRRGIPGHPAHDAEELSS